MNLRTHAALALDRKKLAAFSALGGGFLLFPIGDRRCNRTRASVGNARGNARPSLTNATLAASRLLHRRSPTASPRARFPGDAGPADDQQRHANESIFLYAFDLIELNAVQSSRVSAPT